MFTVYMGSQAMSLSVFSLGPRFALKIAKLAEKAITCSVPCHTSNYNFGIFRKSKFQNRLILLYPRVSLHMLKTSIKFNVQSTPDFTEAHDMF